MHNAAALICLVLLPQCVSAQTPAPVNEGELLHQYLTSWYSPVALLSAGASAGIGQWRHKPQEWQEGGEGFGQRFGSAYAGHMVYSSLLFGGSSLFHEDNRYVPSGRPGAGSRIGYAISSAVLARHADPERSSRRRLSASRIAAFAGAALISRTWQPKSTRTLHNAGISVSISVGVAMGFNVAREFLPGWLPQ